MRNQPSFCPIAIVGLGATFPGSDSAQGFWRDIINGKDLITEVPPSHWLIEDYYDPDPKTPDKTYCKRGAFLNPVQFNPLEYGIPPANLSQTDSTQLLALMVVKQVLIDAFGKDFDKVSLKNASVILGVTSAQELCAYASARLQHPIWRKALRQAGVSQDKEDEFCQYMSQSYVGWGENMFPGLLGNVVSGRIANRFNFGGTNCVVDAACASSLSALSMAIDELQLGRSDLAITGGADTMNDIFMFMCFSKTPALSLTGDCRPFAKAADGTILGEGIGLLALKRLEDAEREGNTIYAVIRGVGSSSDGRSKSVYAPVPEGQALAINRCYAAAQFSPESVELIEAHGTGTMAGDAAEVAGLKQVFVNDKTAKPWCALGSIKSQIGHTKAAAGSAALFKAVLALRHKTLPPTIKVDEPNPKLGLEDSAFYLNTKTRPWVGNSKHPRRAGVSAFGFGGTNFHIALEEYLGPGKLAGRLRTFSSELILLSATSPAALLEKINQLINEEQSLAYLAKHSQQQFNAQEPARLAVIATDEQDLKTKLQQSHEQIAKNPNAIPATNDVHYGYGQESGKIAFIFPGQGSQYLNMGGELLKAFDGLQTKWTEINAIPLDTHQRLQDVVFPPPVFSQEAEKAQENALAQTEWTQPALAATSLLYLQLLQEIGLTADGFAGHSFGELVALHAAGVFDQTTLLLLARKRGELMKQASKISGAMTAVIYSDIQSLLDFIQAERLDAVAANFNCPEQTVFSGSQTAIAHLENKLKIQNASYHRLPVSAAFHSPLIKDSHAPFLSYLSSLEFKSPKQAVYANATAQMYSSDPERIKQVLAEQLINPVRFVEQIKAMYDAGIRTFIEVGPQSILSNFVSKILAGKTINTIALDSRKQGVTSLWNAIAQLSVSGIPLNFSAFWKDYVEPEVRTPQVKSFTVQISGANYGKLYPSVDKLKKSSAEIAAELSMALRQQSPEHPPLTHPNERENTMSTINTEKITTDQRHEDSLNHALELYGQIQEEVTKAHLEHQELSEKSHLAYLEEAKVALDDIRALLAEAGYMTPKALEDKVTSAIKTTKSEPSIAQAEPSQAIVAPPAAVISQPPVVMEAVVETAAPATEITAEELALQNTLLAIVAEKTGYPQETLDMNMELEADLGIDSIKRVEILSAMQSQVPNLPALNPTELASLRSFMEIADYIKKQQGA